MILVNVLLILIAAAYFVFYVYQRREKLTSMAGMMIAMTIGMMVSITLGVLLGVYFHHDLTKSTIFAVVAGMIAGYSAGRPISLMAAMDGMLAGIMGGMMGAMLGAMLVFPATMVWFVDIIFAAVMFVLLQLIYEETGSAKKEDNESKRILFGSVGMMVGLIALAGVVLVVTTNLPGVSRAGWNVCGGHASAPAGITGDVQEAKIHFKAEEGAACLRQVVSFFFYSLWILCSKHI